MPTATLNDPIDGAELKQIILQRISAALDRDCTLTNDIAYPGFALSFDIRLRYPRSKPADTLVWGSITEHEGEPTSDPHEIVAVSTSDEYESNSPNAAREDHDLPIPVMIQTPNGPERRKIHVTAAKAKPGRPPKAANAVEASK